MAARTPTLSGTMRAECVSRKCIICANLTEDTPEGGFTCGHKGTCLGTATAPLVSEPPAALAKGAVSEASAAPASFDKGSY